jgi:hypothetical protein
MAEIIEKDLTLLTGYLPQQYSEAEKLHQFLNLFLEQVQELEEANVELDRVSTDIELAYGYQLDIIGKLIGVERQGSSDEEYRADIYFQISLNIGSGTPEDCIQYLSFVTKATKVRYWERYPASILMETNGNNIPSNLAITLDNVALAGVSLEAILIINTDYVFRGGSVGLAYNNAVPDGLGGFVFNPVPDSDPLARHILPSVTYTGDGQGILASVLTK